MGIETRVRNFFRRKALPHILTLVTAMSIAPRDAETFNTPYAKLGMSTSLNLKDTLQPSSYAKAGDSEPAGSVDTTMRRETINLEGPIREIGEGLLSSKDGTIFLNPDDSRYGNADITVGNFGPHGEYGAKITLEPNDISMLFSIPIETGDGATLITYRLSTASPDVNIAAGGLDIRRAPDGSYPYSNMNGSIGYYQSARSVDQAGKGLADVSTMVDPRTNAFVSFLQLANLISDNTLDVFVQGVNITYTGRTMDEITSDLQTYDGDVQRHTLELNPPATYFTQGTMRSDGQTADGLLLMTPRGFTTPSWDIGSIEGQKAIGVRTTLEPGNAQLGLSPVYHFGRGAYFITSSVGTNNENLNTAVVALEVYPDSDGTFKFGNFDGSIAVNQGVTSNELTNTLAGYSTFLFPGTEAVAIGLQGANPNSHDTMKLNLDEITVTYVPAKDINDLEQRLIEMYGLNGNGSNPNPTATPQRPTDTPYPTHPPTATLYPPTPEPSPTLEPTPIPTNSPTPTQYVSPTPELSPTPVPPPFYISFLDDVGGQRIPITGTDIDQLSNRVIVIVVTDPENPQFSGNAALSVAGPQDGDQIASYHFYVRTNNGLYEFLGRTLLDSIDQLVWAHGGDATDNQTIISPNLRDGPSSNQETHYKFTAYRIYSNAKPSVVSLPATLIYRVIDDSTPTPQPTSTLTPTPLPTDTLVPTPAPSDTPYLQIINTPTSTITPTNTPTNTPPDTATPTRVPTPIAPNYSPTPTATATPTPDLPDLIVSLEDIAQRVNLPDIIMTYVPQGTEFYIISANGVNNPSQNIVRRGTYNGTDSTVLENVTPGNYRLVISEQHINGKHFEQYIGPSFSLLEDRSVSGIGVDNLELNIKAYRHMHQNENGVNSNTGTTQRQRVGNPLDIFIYTGPALDENYQPTGTMANQDELDWLVNTGIMTEMVNYTGGFAMDAPVTYVNNFRNLPAPGTDDSLLILYDDNLPTESDGAVAVWSNNGEITSATILLKTFDKMKADNPFVSEVDLIKRQRNALLKEAVSAYTNNEPPGNINFPDRLYENTGLLPNQSVSTVGGNLTTLSRYDIISGNVTYSMNPKAGPGFVNK